MLTICRIQNTPSRTENQHQAIIHLSATFIHQRLPSYIHRYIGNFDFCCLKISTDHSLISVIHLIRLISMPPLLGNNISKIPLIFLLVCLRCGDLSPPALTSKLFILTPAKGTYLSLLDSSPGQHRHPSSPLLIIFSLTWPNTFHHPQTQVHTQYLTLLFVLLL